MSANIFVSKDSNKNLRNKNQKVQLNFCFCLHHTPLLNLGSRPLSTPTLLYVVVARPSKRTFFGLTKKLFYLIFIKGRQTPTCFLIIYSITAVRVGGASHVPWRDHQTTKLAAQLLRYRLRDGCTADILVLLHPNSFPA